MWCHFFVRSHSPLKIIACTEINSRSVANYYISLLSCLRKVIWCFIAHGVKSCQSLQWKRFIAFLNTAVCIVQCFSFTSNYCLLQLVRKKNYTNSTDLFLCFILFQLAYSLQWNKPSVRLNCLWYLSVCLCLTVSLLPELSSSQPKYSINLPEDPRSPSGQLEQPSNYQKET